MAGSASRKAAARAWGETPGELQALELARTYFPEFSEGGAEAPVHDETALRVRLPEAEGEELELATRGRVFRVKEEGREAARGRRPVGAAAFYGTSHLWTAVKGRSVDASGRWVTQRVEQYDVAPEGADAHRARYAVTVPEDVVAVRDVGEYLEFLDARGVPLLRLHYLVARDGAGLSRQGEVRLRGAVRDEGQGAGPVRYTLTGRELAVEMVVALGGMEGTVVVDPGWSSTRDLALARRTHAATTLLSGKVLITGGHTTVSNSATRTAELYDPDTGTWRGVASMVDVRAQHTATLLPSGKVLVAGGTPGSGAYISSELFDPETETWSSTDVLTVGRHSHTATVLPSGLVLVTGGVTGTGGYSSATELFDPSTGSWRPTGDMTTGRALHTATLLRSGQVLVAAGLQTSGNTTELYDPGTGTWRVTGPLVGGVRQGATATLLPTGLVLVAGGGVSTGILGTAELYDPARGTWAATGSMATPHRWHTATLLASGRVLVVGGSSDYNSSWASYNTTAATEVYDPATGAWSSAGSLPDSSRMEHTASILPSGKVLVTGGLFWSLSTKTVQDAVASYEPTGGSWSALAAMATARSAHTTTLLPTGKLLVAGGESGGVPSATAEVHDRASGLWSSVGAMLTPRSGHTATLLPSGKVLVTGGSGSDTAELYDPYSQGWTSAGRMATARTGHTATLLPSGRVLVLGGSSGSGAVSSAEVFDPRSGLWTSVRPMSTVRERHAAILLTSGKVLVTGGTNGATPLGTAEVYDPLTDTWSAPLTMGGARVDHAVTLLASGRVLLSGGSNSNGPLATAELYDATTSTWTPAGRMSVGRSGHTATLLFSGEVVVVGGVTGPGSYANSIERYEPSTNTWSVMSQMTVPRTEHTATLGRSGEVLVVGGRNTVPVASMEQFSPTSAPGTGSPTLDTPQVVRPGAPFIVAGSGFRGSSEGSGGGTSSTAGNVPQLRFLSIEGGALAPLPRVDSWNPAGTQLTARAPALMPGQYLLLVTVNGVTGGRGVRVTDSNAAPVAQSLARTLPKNAPATVALQATDMDSDALLYTVVQGPRYGTLSGGGANLIYTPQPGFSGTDTFTWRASDGLAESNVATVTLSVTNTQPVALGVVVTTSKGRAVPVTLLGLDADEDPLTFRVASVPSRGALSGTAPHLTYTPDSGFAGNDSFTFRVNDGTVDSRTVAVTVRVLNLAPVTYPGTATVASGRNVLVTLDATDVDGDPLTYTVVQAPLHGTLSGTAPHLVYTPEAGYAGEDAFTFRARDGTADSNVSTFSMRITERPVNAPPSVPVPTSPSDGATLPEGMVTLTWNASTDPEGDAVSYRVELTQGGTLLASLNTSSASLTLPGILWAGQYTWQVEALDGRGNRSGPSASASFTIAGSLVTSAWRELGGSVAPEHQDSASEGPGCSATGGGGWSVWAATLAVLALGGRRRKRVGPA
ncbi:MAG TPA: kelch repeat-containing protein, partial [Myxococcus sp.]|nr:kelch repeat-containing protein [Myxococcus sp.]